MSEPFDFLNSIMRNGKYLMNNEQDEKDYIPFFINRGLSQQVDCLMLANDMNLNNHLDAKLQYDYLFNTIRKRNRPYSKWAKRADNDAIQAVSKYYEVNFRRAKEYVAVLSKKQQDIIIKKMEEVYGK